MHFGDNIDVNLLKQLYGEAQYMLPFFCWIYVGYIHIVANNIVNNFVNNFFCKKVAYIKYFCIFAV